MDEPNQLTVDVSNINDFKNTLDKFTDNGGFLHGVIKLFAKPNMGPDP